MVLDRAPECLQTQKMAEIYEKEVLAKIGRQKFVDLSAQKPILEVMKERREEVKEFLAQDFHRIGYSEANGVGTMYKDNAIVAQGPPISELLTAVHSNFDGSTGTPADGKAGHKSEGSGI